MASKVTVACNLPNGLLLHLDNMVEGTEPVLGGGTRKVQVAQKNFAAGEVRILGTGTMFGRQPRSLVVGGYAMTPNVDKDFIEEWMRQNKDSDLVKNKLIFVASTGKRAQDQAKDQKEMRSGLEPLNTEMKEVKGRKVPVDPRFPRTLNPSLSDIERSDRKD